MSINDLLATICSAEKEAGELMLNAHKVVSHNKGSDKNIVTQYDVKVQELLISRITEVLPQAGFYCEEMDIRDKLGSSNLFIIDPIDGTMNFAHELNHSCISVAYVNSGEVLASAIYNPYADELFTTIKGKGAYLNWKRIFIDEKPLKQCLIAVGTAPYYPELSYTTMRIIDISLRTGLDIRRKGSAALDLCDVAVGRVGLYCEPVLSVWDYAAGLLLVKEAGGCVLGMDGGEIDMSAPKSSVIAGGAEAVNNFIELLSEKSDRQDLPG